MLIALVLMSALLQTKPATVPAASAAQAPAAKAGIPESAYAPLELYNGTWKIVPGHHDRPYDTLVNHCHREDLYYSCTQTVNGVLAALVVFVPTDVPGRYHSQVVMPSGEAVGRSDITIDGDLWSYNSQEDRNGKTYYYRTVNTFTGKDKIHYSQQTSSDGVHYDEKSSGDEQREP
jgi:hypothetical protein